RRGRGECPGLLARHPSRQGRGAGKGRRDPQIENRCRTGGGAGSKRGVLGEVGRQYFAKKQMDVDTNFRYTVQKPTMHRARQISERMIDLYLTGKLDEVYIIYTQMINSVTMEAEVEQL
ncbi:hypothetical protein GO594_30980, partial [Pseudomonas otitidis]|nr:hypothetical protein [Pseudomonas otitidis]